MGVNDDCGMELLAAKVALLGHGAMLTVDARAHDQLECPSDAMDDSRFRSRELRLVYEHRLMQY